MQQCPKWPLHLFDLFAPIPPWREPWRPDRHHRQRQHPLPAALVPTIVMVPARNPCPPAGLKDVVAHPREFLPQAVSGQPHARRVRGHQQNAATRILPRPPRPARPAEPLSMCPGDPSRALPRLQIAPGPCAGHSRKNNRHTITNGKGSGKNGLLSSAKRQPSGQAGTCAQAPLSNARQPSALVIECAGHPAIRRCSWQPAPC